MKNAQTKRLLVFILLLIPILYVRLLESQALGKELIDEIIPGYYIPKSAFGCGLLFTKDSDTKIIIVNLIGSVECEKEPATIFECKGLSCVVKVDDPEYVFSTEYETFSKGKGIFERDYRC